MEASGPADYVHAGAEVEVIGVAQDNLRVYVVAEFVHVHALYGAARPHGHEDGSEYASVVGVDGAGARPAARALMFEGVFHQKSLSGILAFGVQACRLATTVGRSSG